MLSMKVGQFPVEAVLVEEKIEIDREFFLSFAIDDAARAPMIFSRVAGAQESKNVRLRRDGSVRREPRTIRFGVCRKPFLRAGFRQSRLMIWRKRSANYLPRPAVWKRGRSKSIRWS